MHSISRFRARLATVLSLRPLCFSVEPSRSAGGSDPVTDRSFESIPPQAVSQTDCRSKGSRRTPVGRGLMLIHSAERKVRIHLPPPASHVDAVLLLLSTRQTGRLSRSEIVPHGSYPAQGSPTAAFAALSTPRRADNPRASDNREGEKAGDDGEPIARCRQGIVTPTEWRRGGS
jgi:hypothetical protein